MSWLSNLRKNPAKMTAEALYLAIVAQARRPIFFMDLGVPDTVDGRFDLIVVHSYLVLRRLKAAGEEGQELAQLLFDEVFSNFDASLREMGVGDLIVGKRIKSMATAYYGRVEAYEAPLLAEDQTGLCQALMRNVYRGEEALEDQARALAAYMIEAYTCLSGQQISHIFEGKLHFGDGPVATADRKEVSEQ